MSEVKIILNKSGLRGAVCVPPSKSFTHRAVICASLADGKSKIQNPLMCDDTLATINACKTFGAKIVFKNEFIEIKGIGNKISKKILYAKINCKQSGSTMRFLIPICAVLCNSSEITGEKGLLNRPVVHIVEALKQMNVKISSRRQYPPVFIKKSAPKASTIKIPGNISSQYISGLLFALPLLKEDSEIIITTNVESKNYILMTIDILKKFGIKITTSDDLRKFVIKGNQTYKSLEEFKIEGDYSAAAFMFTAGVIAAKNNIAIEGLNKSSIQGDAKIINILQRMGGEIKFSKNKFIVGKSVLKAVKIDAKDIPDLVPILAVAASQAKGETVIKNIERLKIKESNRAEAIASQLKKMGADISEKRNCLIIKGVSEIKGCEVNSFDDHRIAMALSIASFAAKGDTIIQNPVCVKKSYPAFFDDIRKLGANVIPIFEPFGKKVKMSIYGDSHGKKIGVTLCGIQKNVKIAKRDIQKEMDKRKSVGQLSTQRKEKDKVNIKSGIKNGLTTGEAIKIEILNKNVDSSSYEEIKNTPRPGHADFTAKIKYASAFDYRGGGFASGRMTAPMVAGGAVAKKILENKGVKICAYIKQVGKVALKKNLSFYEIEKNTYSNFVKCPDKMTANKMEKIIKDAKKRSDSVGGIVECIIIGLPVGLGEPLFDSVESVISHAMFSIPAVKGVEFGSGFSAAGMKGSKHNDGFAYDKNNNVIAKSNNSGGVLGGITNSMPVVFRIAIKPTSSIGIKQDTVNIKTFENVKITVGGRHDPCIAIRVPPVAEALTAISILDLYLREFC